MTSKKLGALLRSVPPATATEEPEPPVAISAVGMADAAIRPPARLGAAIGITVTDADIKGKRGRRGV